MSHNQHLSRGAFEVNLFLRVGISRTVCSLGLTVLLGCLDVAAQIVVQDGATNSISKNNYQDSISNTFTVTPGASVLVVETYVQNDIGNDTPPGLSAWGTQTFTRIGGTVNARNVYASSDIFYITNPAPGTHDIIATDNSGGNVTAMAMQVYTLNGVDTAVAPLFFSANKAYALTNSVTLTSVPAGAWAACSFSWGFNGAGNIVSSTSGTLGFAQVFNDLPGYIGHAVLMGGVAGLASGSTTIQIANPNGGGVQSALAVAVFASAGINTNIVTPEFSGLASSTLVNYGTTNLTLSGRVTTNGLYLPAGTVISATIDGNTQYSTINDATGDFSIQYNTIGIPSRVTPYPITYASSSATRFLSATNTTTTVTIGPLPVNLSGYKLYDGSTSVSVENLFTANLVACDDLTLLGSVSVAGTNAGPQAITTFGGLSLDGAAATNYTLVGGSGSVMIVAPGGDKNPGRTNWLGVFRSAADIAGWVPSGGSATCSLSFLPGDAPPWGPSTGALVVQVAVPTNGMWSNFGKSLTPTNLSGYTQLEFDVKVGTNQTVWSIYGTACNTLSPAVLNPDTHYGSQPPVWPTAAYNGWQHWVIPATAFGGSSNLVNVQKMMFQPVSAPFPVSATIVLEIANIKWVTPPAEANPTIVIDPGNVVRRADARWYGINVGSYDLDFNLQHTAPMARSAGWNIFRYPGGSVADNFHWATSVTSGQNNTFSNFCKVVTNLHADAMITVNYGTGTPEEAAAWVAHANITNHLGFKYWEIGNEIFAWPTERDDNIPGHDPYLYGARSAVYIQQMKAVDPTIKIGVVVVPGLQIDPGTNGLHYATNLVTGQVFSGWTPVVMSQLRQAGVIPDFVIYHCYPQNGAEDDQKLLAMNNWEEDASEIRGDINNFLGAAGTNVEILVTENNGNAANPGKQSVSLVNALYYAESQGQIMKTEINSRVWWQLHDGGPGYTDGDLSSSLYGWRQFGAFGVTHYLNGFEMTNRFPAFFAAELLSRFVSGGDTILSAPGDLPLVSSYAALRTNGSLSLMLINKSPTHYYAPRILINNWLPGETATVNSYGIRQDNAARSGNNNGCSITTNTCAVSANFNYAIAPYSITVFNFSPAPVRPVLSIQPSPAPGQFILQLAGQAGSTYLLEHSTDLQGWTIVATNRLSGNVLAITNLTTASRGAEFWRAMSVP